MKPISSSMPTGILSKQLQQLAQTANDLAEADHQFSELQVSYSQLPELPRQLPEKLLEGIQRDYRNACDQFDNGRSRIIKGRHNQQLDALRPKGQSLYPPGNTGSISLGSSSCRKYPNNGIR